MTLSLTAIVLPMLMQIGPNPSGGGIPDHSAEVQDRPPRPTSATDPADMVSSDRDGWLGNCLELVETAPARAHVQAQLRRDETTEQDKVVANYCLGMAASALELWNDAQTAFVAAREDVGSAEPRLRARFGIMAGNAAIAAGDSVAAMQLLDNAKSDAVIAGSSQLVAVTQLDRARLLVTDGRQTEALAALEEAREQAPQSGEAYLLSATLLRRMDQLDGAQAMIETAAELAPTDVEIALEAGVIAVLSGREDAARASWNSVITLAPDGPPAEAARGYLAQLGDAVPTP